MLSGIITTIHARKTIVERKTAQDYGEIGACDLGDGMPLDLLMCRSFGRQGVVHAHSLAHPAAYVTASSAPSP